MQKDNGVMVPIDEDRVVLEHKRGNADLIFRIGEHVKVKGRDFKISSFGKKMMMLEGLPGTRMKQMK